MSSLFKEKKVYDKEGLAVISFENKVEFESYQYNSKDKPHSGFWLHGYRRNGEICQAATLIFNTYEEIKEWYDKYLYKPKLQAYEYFLPRQTYRHIRILAQSREEADKLFKEKYKGGYIRCQVY